MGSRLTGSGMAVLAAVAAGGLIAACTETAPPPGRDIYRHYCAGCHGAGGDGKGPAASHLPVPPADLTALSLANGGVFPAEHVMATVHGYPGKHDFAVMPEFGPLLEGPQRVWVSPRGEEIMTPVALLDLVAYLEGMQR